MKRTALLIALFLAAPLQAETMKGMDHSGHMAADDAATEAYRAANMAMHEGMDIEYTGNADVDFVRGMIAHHQGAIDMAKIVLEHGSDPEIRKLATGIIAAQQGEIAFMQEWLAKNGQ
ncbi:CopM family metallochaperone [Paragemmobacter straminiformis]|uniref:DUF305 domain-containing protein n=1 Tax=Paragemmobacter straminiformis TaxID=2045119 RepID=A0A842ICE8_9RHOB|nr:DUF305 domain-containing protein [Gemmobacter straminiformis]MBC2836658.1 DUF305 domain-containing protein [Gemmobacter straminiformis]